MLNAEVLIIGGGLSGVTVAHLLAKKGMNALLLEAKDSLGGRILSPITGAGSTTGTAPAVDLGPSWFWPDQHNIAALIKSVNLTEAIYAQSSHGQSVIEYANGTIERTHGGASMAGSLRLDGGIMHLVNRVAHTLPTDTVQCNTVVQEIALTEHGVTTTAIRGTQRLEFNSQRVVLALPPRVVAESFAIKPVIASDYGEKLSSVATWMAGEAKLVATYATPFWQEQGLSGDGMSQIGPMMEMHDASPRLGGPHALFGFVGGTASERRDNEAAIKRSALGQITRMFGAAGAEPLDVYFKDWAFDSLTATRMDRRTPRAHPDTRDVDRAEWGRRLVWAGSEMAGSDFAYAGYLEGAVESANRAVRMLID